MAADGRSPTNLTGNGALDDYPCWSPDLDTPKILFSSNRNANRDIFVMDADGSNLRRLTHGNADNARPVWSPNGKQLAFHSYS